MPVVLHSDGSDEPCGRSFTTLMGKSDLSLCQNFTHQLILVSESGGVCVCVVSRPIHPPHLVSPPVSSPLVGWSARLLVSVLKENKTAPPLYTVLMHLHHHHHPRLHQFSQLRTGWSEAF